LACLLLETDAMNGKNIDDNDVLDDVSSDDDDVVDDVSSDASLTETVVLTEVDEDAVGDSTIEMDIEKLVEKLDASDSDDVRHKAEIRRKVEELREQREKELDSTFNFNMDDD
jgi:hypothetical protein